MIFQVVGSGPILNFLLTNQTTGIYTCKATSKGFSPIKTAISVSLLGPPQILPGREVQFGTPTEKAFVICEAKATPKVQSVEWFYGGKEIRKETSNFSIVETQHGDVIRSTLIIQKLSKKHFGEYWCRARNQMGEVSVAIRLKAVGKLEFINDMTNFP